MEVADRNYIGEPENGTGFELPMRSPVVFVAEPWKTSRDGRGEGADAGSFVARCASRNSRRI